MDLEPRNNEEVRQSRLVRIGTALAGFLRDARDQLRAADVNLGEGSLRSSIAPDGYLPPIPDFPPLHDDTII